MWTEFKVGDYVRQIGTERVRRVTNVNGCGNYAMYKLDEGRYFAGSELIHVPVEYDRGFADGYSSGFDSGLRRGRAI